MHTRLIRCADAQDLLVYFAGWGTPEAAVAHLRLPEHTDLLVCSDYRTLEHDVDFTPYRHIRVAAWSMGVWAAERVMQGIDVAFAAAINGTGRPRDDVFGIPAAVFDQTLAGLNDTSRRKFEQRMCGNAFAAEAYRALSGRRDTDNLRAELAALQQAVRADTRTDLIRWHQAFIGGSDRIFPAAHQQAYWQPRCPTQTFSDGTHYPWTQWQEWAELWRQ